jgi:Ca2+-binding EF-hand superfamily protein
MIAVYNHSRMGVLFFVAFILMATFFMMNLFTAVAFLKYQAIEQEFEQQALSMTEAHLRKAFALLDLNGTGALERQELIGLLDELRKAHLLHDIAQV